MKTPEQWIEELGDMPRKTPEIMRRFFESIQHDAQPQWMEISSAPRDGTDILGFVQHSNVHYCPISERYKWQHVAVISWIDHNGGGWTWTGGVGKPTHWQPLPQPPAASGGGAR